MKRMLSKPEFYNWIERLHSDVREVYREHRTDYRGRIVSCEHVLRYLDCGTNRFLEIIQAVSDFPNHKRVLDIGLAYGFVAILLQELLDRDVSGMELPENINAYCALLERYQIQVLPDRLCNKPSQVESESVDLVVFSEVLEHLRISPLEALIEIRRMLRPGGVLVLTTPNIASLSNIVALLRGKNIVERLPDRSDGLDHITDLMTHIREYTMQELHVLMGRAGLEIVRTRFSVATDKSPVGFIRRAVSILPRVVPSLRELVFLVGKKP